MRDGGKKVGGAYGLDNLWKGDVDLQYFSKWGVAWQLTQQAFRSLCASPFTSILALLTITVVMLLVGALLLVSQHTYGLMADAGRGLTISVYLKDAAAESEVAGLKQAIQAAPQVAEVRYISKDEALKSFHKSLGEQAGLLEGLETDNPLPASVEVTLGQERLDQEGFEQFAASFRENPAVESIQYDRGLVGQAAALFHFFGSVGLGAAALLLLLAAFIITNTIRLMLYARRHEIVIMRMVGATAGFVIAPCLIEGCALGLLGAVAGLVVLYFLFLLLTGLLAQLELVRAILPQLTFLPWYYVFLVILMGVAVGAAGSFMAVRRLADE